MTRNSQKLFIWRGINAHNEIVTGKTKARNAAELREELQKIKIIPVSIRNNFFALPIFSQTKKVPRKHIRDFTQQLARLINAGISLVSALEIIEKCADHVFAKKLFAEIRFGLEQGNALTSVLRKHPIYFNSLFCGLISAGEKSGSLDQMLNYLADYEEKISTQKRKIKKIIFYPATVLVFTIIITCGLLIFVIPQFQTMFESFGAQLPLYTQAIINLANYIRINGLPLLTIITLMVSGIIFAIKNICAFKQLLDRLIIRVPYFGLAFKKAYFARIARTLAVTLRSGMPLNDTLSIANDVVDNYVYRGALTSIRDKIAKGFSLSYAMRSEHVFPERALQLITIGEESGTLDEMLFRVAVYYDDEVTYLTENLQSLLEPMLMVVLGTIVGGLIIGMYLPIFQMGKIV